MNTASTKPTKSEIQQGRRASYLSLVVGSVLLATKFWGYQITGSEAVFADAMESIVNVVAAALAIFVVATSAKPADRDHPYGHGKIEYFSAAFEGGLIAFASVLIAFEAASALWTGAAVHEIGFGLAVALGTGAANCLLGWYLIHAGRKSQSAALVASGQHVLSDFYTSLGVAAGLLAASLTGLAWLDSLSAIALAGWLGFTGVKIVRGSIGGLLDEEDRDSLRAFASAAELEPHRGIIQIHHVRSIRSGRFHHIDAHVVVPEFWDVVHAHASTEAFEMGLMRRYPFEGELHLHLDPCRSAYCRHCDEPSCPIRKDPFEFKRKWTLEELTHPEEPATYGAGSSSGATH